MVHFGLLALAVLIADQMSKLIVVSTLADRGPLVIIPRAFQFIYRTNTGAAFSIFQEHTMALTVFASFVAVGLAFWGWRLRPEEVMLRWPLALIFGGAVANLIDRYRLGHVTDFIDAHWDNVYHFPTFNVADSAICIGMGLLIWMSLWGAPSPAEQRATAQEI